MPPALHIDQTPDTLSLRITGRLDVHGVAALWRSGTDAAKQGSGKKVTIDVEGVTAIDMAGATFITRLRDLSGDLGGQPEIRGLDQNDRDLIALAETRKQAPAAEKPLGPVEQAGADLAGFLEDVRTFVTFVGEITWALASSLKRPKTIRWAETLLVAERAGVNGLPIVLLIAFIVGLVMAFQAAIPMKTFGAEIYVANLIGIAMVRELGPLMTAIVLAGRSASAFAAEIGTMKINEEIDALTVMGLAPVHFLIVPRVVAATLITPLLTVFADLVGILGGAVVILSMGYPPIAYYNQVVGFVSWQDLTGGLVKSVVFGLIIAATGCIRGYQTRRGPSAVGEATTRAVVTSIILIAVFDGIFSVIYYYLGI
jgi:phospholipid/cholesterol/gamma-HCH transport system permease protein